MQSLKNYLLNECNGQFLFDEEAERGISKGARSKLMGFCSTLIRTLTNGYPSLHQKQTMAESIRINFLSLTYKESGSYVSLFYLKVICDSLEFLKLFIRCFKVNSKIFSSVFTIISSSFLQDLILNGTNGGWLGQRLKNDRSALKKPSTQEQQQQYLDGENTAESSPQNLSLVVQSLKALTISTQNEDEIRQKLKETFDYRKELSKDSSIEFAKRFPLFFVDSKWVSLCLLLFV